jgi:hypothetical protein
MIPLVREDAVFPDMAPPPGETVAGTRARHVACATPRNIAMLLLIALTMTNDGLL